MTVRPERTHWRDEKISSRHREWGFNCPMVDIDFLVVEYDLSEPKAIIEYKHENAVIDFTKLTTMGMATQSYRALEKLASASNIPFFVVKYNDAFSDWRITPMNKEANNIEIKKEYLTESEYVELLYKIRGRPLPEEIKNKIDPMGIVNTETPTSVFRGDPIGF